MMNQTLAEGLGGFRPRQLRLKPANDNGAKEYSGSADNRILFLIGSYPNSWLNNARSYIEFKATCSSSEANDATVRFKHGIPVWERIVVRSGGKLLCDVRDADVLDLLLQNMYDAEHLRKIADHIGNYKGYDAVISENADIEAMRAKMGAQQRAGAVYRKQLPGVGMFDPSTFVPIGLLGSSSNAPAIEVELFLKPASDVLELHDGAELNVPGAAEYKLSNVRFNLELTTLPEASYLALNERLYAGGEYRFDFPMYRSYRNYLSGGTSYDVDIHNSVKNLENVMVVFRKQGANNNHLFMGSGGRLIGNLTDAANTTPDDFKLNSFQFRLGSEFFPSEKIEINSEAKEALFHALRTTDMLYGDKQPLFATMDSNGRTKWKDGGCFAVVQGFKTTSGMAKNGLATMSQGVPLQLQLEFSAANAASGIQAPSGIELLAFAKETMSIRITLNGEVEVVEG